ncbi:MAG: hypothetical protein D6761_00265 [Candidatus Dadabacteria bacterium]|nr:MAG: hypothetical protein D6761_00265 [Candidatus Dadabacteria bacterium]
MGVRIFLRFCAIFVFAAACKPAEQGDSGGVSFDARVDLESAFEGRLLLDGLGYCAGVPIRLTGPLGSIDVTTATGGGFAVTDAVAGAWRIEAEVDGYEPLDEIIVATSIGDASFDAGTFELREATVALSGRIGVADDGSPQGAAVAVTVTSDDTVPPGLSCAPANTPSVGTEQTWSTIVGPDGRYRVDVPRRSRSVRGRVTHPRYTTGSFTVSDSALAATDQVQLPDLLLYPLTGFVNPAGGQIQNSRAVALQISAFNGASEMSLAAVTAGVACGAASWSAWLEYQATTSVTVPADGPWRICVRVRNSVGQQLDDLWTEVRVDTASPVLTLAPESTTVPSDVITLMVAASDQGSGVRGIRIANDSAETLASAGELSPDPTRLWALTPVSAGTTAQRVIWAQAVDQAGNLSLPVSAVVDVDRQSPTASLAVTGVEGISGRTAQGVVWLTLSGVSSDVQQMRVSTLPTFSGAVWEPLRTAFPWPLPTGDGTKTLYVEVRDAAGNSSVNAGSIVLDTTPPPVPALQIRDLDGDLFAVAQTEVELAWSDFSAVEPTLQGYEVQQLVSGQPDFVTIAQVGALQHTFRADVSATTGALHSWRVRTLDDLGLVSAWSNVVATVPFAPVDEAFWLRDVDGTWQFGYRPNAGTFSLSGRLSASTRDGLTDSVLFADGQWTATLPNGDDRVNGDLRVKTGNVDNSQVQESAFAMPFDTIEQIATQTPTQLSAARGIDGFLRAVWRNNGAIEYAQETTAGWSVTTVSSDGIYPVIAVDPQGIPEMAWAKQSEIRLARENAGAWDVSDPGGWGTQGRIAFVIDTAGARHLAFSDIGGTLWYATDATGTWSREPVTSRVVSIEDPALAVAGNVIELVWRDNGLHYARKQGGGWSFALLDANTNAGHQSVLRVHPDGSTRLVYTTQQSPANQILHAARRDAGSGSWSVTFATLPTGIAHFLLSADMDRFGQWLLAAYGTGTAGSSTWLLSSPDGVTFDAVQVDRQGAPGKFAIVAREDSSADLLLTIQGLSGVYHMHASGRRTLPQVFHREANIQGGLDAALDPSGIHLLYNPGGRLVYAHDATGPWHYETVTVQSGIVGQNAIALSNGVAHAAWFNQTGRDLYYARRTTTGAWQTWLVDATGDIGRYPSVLPDSGGMVDIVCQQVGGMDQLVHYRGQDASWTRETIETDSDTGLFASAARSWDGRVGIVYGNLTQGEVRYVEQTKAGWSVSTIASSAGGVQATALAFDATGRPHVAFVTSGSFDLYYAVREDGQWQVEPIETAGTAGPGLDLAVDAQGRPSVIYGWLAGGVASAAVAIRVGGQWLRGRLVGTADAPFLNPDSTRLIIDAAGRPHAFVYSDDSGQGLYLHDFAGSVSAKDIVRVQPF